LGNYKGGVGKTTSTFQIAVHFANRGKKVLLIDLDPQCSLSNICCKGVNMSVEELKVEETLNYVLELYVREIGANNKFVFQIMTNTVCAETENSLKGTIEHFMNNWQNSELYFIPSSLSFTNARINELAQFMNANMLNIFLIKQFLSDVQSLGQNEENGVPLFDYVFLTAIRLQIY